MLMRGELWMEIGYGTIGVCLFNFIESSTHETHVILVQRRHGPMAVLGHWHRIALKQQVQKP